MNIRTDNKDSIIKDYDTLIMAVGRIPETSNLGNIELDKNKKGKIIVNDKWETSQSNVYAIGDVKDKGPELTPIAIREG